ncbi:MAG: hypothetical protein SGJ10_09615 [Bacteroidota bacterium]|nr:hypothetical protein [Bacteroidota bacterium]
MKKIFTPLALAAIVFVAGCSKTSLPVKFDFTPKTVEFTVPVTSQAGDMTFVLNKLDYNLDSLAKANSISLSQIKSIKLAEVRLDIIDQNGSTFDLVSWAEAYCKVDNQAEIKIASKNPIPADHVRTIMLDVVPQELVTYLKSSSAQFRLSGRTNAPIVNPIQMRATVRLNVVGELIN